MDFYREQKNPPAPKHRGVRIITIKTTMETGRGNGGFCFLCGFYVLAVKKGREPHEEQIGQDQQDGKINPRLVIVLSQDLPPR